MSQSASTPERLRVAALRNNQPTAFDLRPDEARRDALAAELGLLGLKKLRLAGEIRPEGRDAWRLEATIGATVTQPCVVTLAPVTTRIDEPVSRLWRPEEEFAAIPEGAEVEMTDDETDPLPDVIDLGAVMAEALSLALPLYPHAEGAEAAAEALEEQAAPAPEDERPNPFAALSGLRARMESDADDGEGGENR